MFRSPTYELIDPSLLAIDRAFVQEFDGMTIVRLPLKALFEARERLIEEVRARIIDGAAGFSRTWAVSRCSARRANTQ